LWQTHQPDLKPTRRNSAIVERIAKFIIDLVRNGEQHPEKSREPVLGAYPGA
jgi:hypothetical protein